MHFQLALHERKQKDNEIGHIMLKDLLQLSDKSYNLSITGEDRLIRVMKTCPPFFLKEQQISGGERNIVQRISNSSHFTTYSCPDSPL